MAREATDFWTDRTDVLFTSFWGWSPDTWGTVGWTGKRGLSRRSNLLKQLTNPFITVCYVTSNKTYIDSDLKGKIAGFYLVSHEIGDRDEFTHPIHHERDPEKWRHSLRALRAFNYLPEYRLDLADFDRTMLNRARSISAMGEILTDRALVTRLREIPFVEVEVYGRVSASGRKVDVDPTRGMVPAGPVNAEGYVVQGGSQFMPRELYILRLDGDTDAYLGWPAKGRVIIKIGLAASPDMRRQSLQKAMPRGTFEWKIERTTSLRGMAPYASFAIAVKGEDAMKRYLAQHADWLDGEFYLASREDVEAAWQAGCAAAQE
jgi:hypothetical protein